MRHFVWKACATFALFLIGVLVATQVSHAAKLKKPKFRPKVAPQGPPVFPRPL